MSTRFSLASAKNPMERLSGDQKGSDAPSVPGRTFAASASSAHSHSDGRPADVATKTIFCPSGETARLSGCVVGGVVSSR